MAVVVVCRLCKDKGSIADPYERLGKKPTVIYSPCPALCDRGKGLMIGLMRVALIGT